MAKESPIAWTPLSIAVVTGKCDEVGKERRMGDTNACCIMCSVHLNISLLCSIFIGMCLLWVVSSLSLPVHILLLLPSLLQSSYCCVCLCLQMKLQLFAEVLAELILSYIDFYDISGTSFCTFDLQWLQNCQSITDNNYLTKMKTY